MGSGNDLVVRRTEKLTCQPTLLFEIRANFGSSPNERRSGLREVLEPESAAVARSEPTFRSSVIWSTSSYRDDVSFLQAEAFLTKIAQVTFPGRLKLPGALTWYKDYHVMDNTVFPSIYSYNGDSWLFGVLSFWCCWCSFVVLRFFVL